MFLSKYISFVLFLSVVAFHSIDNNELETSVITYVCKYVTDNLQSTSIKIFTESTKQMSRVSLLLMQNLIKVNPTTFTEKHFLNVNTEKVDQLTESLCLWSGRGVPIVVFIDEHDGESETEISNRLMKMIDLVVQFSPKSSRPKYLIIVTTRTVHISYLNCFKHAWNYDILDISVIEIIVHVEQRFLIQPLLKIILHTCNPFSNDYSVNYLESNIPLFGNKLKNLNGKVLNAVYYEEFPEVMFDANYTGQEAWDAMIGTQVLLMNILKKYFNFLIKLTHTTHQYEYLSRFNLSYAKKNEVFAKNLVNFSVSNFIVKSDVPLAQTPYEVGCSTPPNPNHFIVRQIGSKLMKISVNRLMTLIAVSIVIILAVGASSKLLKDRQVWSALNLFRMLMRMDVIPKPRSLPDKIFLICLTCWSMMFMEQMLENLLSIQLMENTYEELDTHKKLVNLKILPSLTKHTKKHLKDRTETALRRIARTSKTIETSNEECLWQLMNDHKDFEGCEVSKLVGKYAIRAYSKNRRSSILTLVEEPLSSGITALFFAKTSPYVHQFELTVMRLRDAGIMQMIPTTLDHHMLRNFQMYETNCSGVPISLENNVFKVSSASLIMLILMGSLSGCVSFLIECIWKRFDSTTRNPNSKAFKDRYNELFKQSNVTV